MRSPIKTLATAGLALVLTVGVTAATAVGFDTAAGGGMGCCMPYR